MVKKCYLQMAVINISHNTELFSTILLTKDINTLTI
jgi:hypothetical protein